MEIIKQIENSINKLPFNYNAKRVYLYLLKKQKATAREISIAVKLNRTTVYKIIEELKKTGLARKESAKFGSKIIINSPHKLSLFAQENAVEANNAYNEIKTLLPELLVLSKVKNKETNVLYFEGVAGIKEMYNDILISHKINPKIEVIGVSNCSLAIKNLPLRWANQHRKAVSEAEIKRRFFVPFGDEPDNYIKNYYEKYNLKNFAEFKKIPNQNLKIETEISIYGNKMSFISLKAEQPMAVIIEDEILTDSLRTIFESLWGGDDLKQ